MTAVAFKGIVKIQTGNGNVVQYPINASDVNAQNWTFQDGSTDFQIPLSYGNCKIVDVLLTGNGTDTDRSELVVNSKLTGVIITHSANRETTVGRQFQNGAGVGIAQGSKIAFTQRAV